MFSSPLALSFLKTFFLFYPLHLAMCSYIISYLINLPILAAGDLIANLQLKDLSRVKQISAFRGTLSVVPLAPAKVCTSLLSLSFLSVFLPLPLLPLSLFFLSLPFFLYLPLIVNFFP